MAYNTRPPIQRVKSGALFASDAAARRKRAARVERALSACGLSGAGRLVEGVASAVASSVDLDGEKYYNRGLRVDMEANFGSISNNCVQADVIRGHYIASGMNSQSRVGNEIIVTRLRLSFLVEGEANIRYTTLRVVLAWFRKPGLAIDGPYFKQDAVDTEDPIVQSVHSGLVEVVHDSVHMLEPSFLSYSLVMSAGNGVLESVYERARKHFVLDFTFNEKVTFDGAGYNAHTDKQLVLMMVSDSHVYPHPGVVQGGSCALWWRG